MNEPGVGVEKDGEDDAIGTVCTVVNGLWLCVRV